MCIKIQRVKKLKIIFIRNWYHIEKNFLTCVATQHTVFPLISAGPQTSAAL